MTPILARMGAGSGLGGWNWYDLPFIALASGIVYPDKVADWLGSRFDRTFGLSMLVIIEILFVALAILLTDMLRGMNVHMAWWYPLGSVALVAFIRMMISFIDDMFGISKW